MLVVDVFGVCSYCWVFGGECSVSIYSEYCFEVRVFGVVCDKVQNHACSISCGRVGPGLTSLVRFFLGVPDQI